MAPEIGLTKAAKTRFAHQHPRLFLLLSASSGILLAIAAVWAFLGIADEVPENGPMVWLDKAISAFVERTGTELGENVFRVVSWLGAPVLAAVITVVALRYALKRDWVRSVAVVAAAAGATLLNYALKALFHRGRPEGASEFIHGVSWSFPSGHAMGSIVGYGFLTHLILEHVHDKTRRRLVVAGATLLIAAIGFSRLYLDVHYLSDVVGGFLAGTVWLLVCIGGYSFAKAHVRSHVAG